MMNRYHLSPELKATVFVNGGEYPCMVEACIGQLPKLIQHSQRTVEIRLSAAAYTQITGEQLKSTISHVRRWVAAWIVALDTEPETIELAEVIPPSENEIRRSTSHNPARPTIIKHKIPTSNFMFKQIGEPK